MNYKLSKFNYYIGEDLVDEDNLTIFNTKSRKIVNVSICLLNNLGGAGDATINKLKEYGVIVRADCDELRELDTAITNKKYDPHKLFLTIIPTNACNFKCVYCYQPTRAEVMKKETINGVLRWLSTNLRYYKELSLNWFGGEPLLCKNEIVELLKAIKELCKENGVAMVSSITTNGYLLDIDTFCEFVKYGLRYYQITIDGTEKIHNAQRPHKTNNDSYNRIIANLEKIKSLPSRVRFEIGIRINISKQMSLADINDFVNQIKCLFDDKRFVIIWQWVRDWGGDRLNENKENLLGNCDGEVNENLCVAYMEYAANSGVNMPNLLAVSSGTDACEAFYKNGYVINFDGKVFKCAMCMEDEEYNCIGCITERGKLNIIEEKENLWLKKDSIETKCEECIFLPMCITNRCHYTAKVREKIKCIEYKEILDWQIKNTTNKEIEKIR